MRFFAQKGGEIVSLKIKMQKSKLGFTLIELLIVIAILGILALGLMAALDPLEQLKRARDTATRTAVEEFYNAALRYYSVKAAFPWGASSQVAVVLSSITSDYIQSLVDMGELKPKFQDEAAFANAVDENNRQQQESNMCDCTREY